MLDCAEKFDVCVIGSGPAGLVVGKSLSEKGAKTIVVESGMGLGRWILDRRMSQLTKYVVSGNANYVAARTRVRAVGGTSNVWTGRCERLHPSDFEKNPYSPDRSGWPFTYGDIEPYYDAAEKTLRVRGGSLSDWHPPRKGPPPLPSNCDISSLKSILAAAGVTVDDSLTATPRRGLRFFRVQRELLPEFLAHRHASLVTGVTATRLAADSDGEITGVEVRDLEGTARTVRARIYVIAAGGIESPRLLLMSRCAASPNGIGNAYDMVGRGFNEHPGVNFYAKIGHRPGTIYPRHKIGRSHQFYDDFRKDGLGSVLPVFIQSWVFPHHLIRFKPSDVLTSMVSILGRAIRPTLYIGATIEMRPVKTNRVSLCEEERDRFGNPLPRLTLSYSEEDERTLDRARELILRIYRDVGAHDVREAEVTWSRHHIGTCCMGENPVASVVDRDLRVHGTRNLYVCGSEVFVTGGAVPPVLTIVALAHRLARHLIERLRSA